MFSIHIPQTRHLSFSGLKVLNLKLLFGNFFQLKDAAFTGIFRIMFKPLVDAVPGFGAVVYSLKELVRTFYLLSMNIERLADTALYIFKFMELRKNLTLD